MTELCHTESRQGGTRCRRQHAVKSMDELLILNNSRDRHNTIDNLTKTKPKTGLKYKIN